MIKEKLYIFDTTLRDGAQTQGVDFSIDDKQKISASLDVLGVDSSVNIGLIKQQIGNKFALQGNLDVDVLKLDESQMRLAVDDILKNYNAPSGHIFNLGAGITPDIKPDKVKMLIDILADISPKYNVK